MKRMLVTGACGQIGSELTAALRDRYGPQNVIATDIRAPISEALREGGPFESLDCVDLDSVARAVQIHRVDTIFHLAAILSAVGEAKPDQAWKVNVTGLYNMLEAARQHQCALFVPSSIGAFGPSTPKDGTPQDTIQRPTTMYGVTKVAGELLCDYYHRRFGTDTRGVRFPGLISYETEPGGGTTDYAVEIFFEALRHGRYTSYLREDTSLDMMYMPDAISAMIDLMEADPARLEHRNAFNVTAFSFTPARLAEEIRRHLPDFRIEYRVDPVRQEIADSWPNSLDDSAAREEWGWKPAYSFVAMVEEMLRKVAERLERPGDRKIR